MLTTAPFSRRHERTPAHIDPRYSLPNADEIEVPYCYTVDSAPELLFDHQSEHGPRVIRVRGSLIASSLATLRELDLFDRYLSHLPSEYHDQVLYVMASSWVPVEVANVHYRACDAMGLTDTQLDTIGQQVSMRVVNTFLGTLLRTVRLLAAPIRLPIQHYPRLWDRLLMGGCCSVTMFGDTNATIESRGVPMFRYRYFRVAYGGILRGATLMFFSSAHCRIRRFTDDSLMVDLTWQ